MDVESLSRLVALASSCLSCVEVQLEMARSERPDPRLQVALERLRRMELALSALKYLARQVRS